MVGITAKLVAVERPFWKGKVTLVSAQTTEGEIGVLFGHQPLPGQPVNNGTVIINTADGKVLVTSAQGGFISVPTSKASILADGAIWADEVNLFEAESSLILDDPAVEAQAELKIHVAYRASAD